MRTVLLGLSGGVDSAVSAYLLSKEYNVIGVTFNLCDDITGFKKYNKMIEDAKRVAELLNIKHYILDYKKRFKKDVINPFIEEYQRGNTPNPCVFCNKNIKFGEFFNTMREFKADYIATGHYVNKVKIGERFYLKRSKNKTKDQSYFLYNIKNEELEKSLFPISDYNKEEIRDIAKKIGLFVHDKKDSQEICFIEDDDYKKFLDDYSSYSRKKGSVVDLEGNKIGEHEGIRNYTVGQRRGLNIALGYRAFVVDIDAKTNTVILGQEKDLYSNIISIDDINILHEDEFDTTKIYTAKIRYAANDDEVKIKYFDKNKMILEFLKPQRAVTRGQSLVIYDKDLMVGGGTIRGYEKCSM